VTAMVRNRRIGFRLSGGLVVLGVAVAYYTAAQIGLLQELVRGQVTPLWPPTGVALVCLLTLGIRAWPGITLGSFLINAPMGPSILVALTITTGDTLAPLCAYWMLRRVGFRTELDRLRDGLALVFLGALTGMLISSTIGSGALVAAGAISENDFWPVWSVWWTGDAMGVLVIAPLLLFLSHARWPRGVPVRRWVEGITLLVSALTVTLFVTNAHMALLFLVFPFVVWAALRFEIGGAALCVLVVSGLTVRAAALGSGPFSGHDLFVKMVNLQAFNGSVALTGLLLAAITTERNRAFQILKVGCRRLFDVATELDR
jgi:integral membrane sensor domain MASE1